MASSVTLLQSIGCAGLQAGARLVCFEILASAWVIGGVIWVGWGNGTVAWLALRFQRGV